MNAGSQDVETFIENGKKVRRLNSHVFSLLKACYPLEDKQASMIKQSGTFVQRIKYPNTPSAFETLPVKGMHHFVSFIHYCGDKLAV